MKSAAVESHPDETLPGKETRPKSATRERDATKRQPPYAVVLHNDDVNGFDFVVEVLRKVFHYDRLKAELLTLQAHETGRSAIWSGSLEVAELKADQVRSCGPDPRMSALGALPLRVTIEPLPS
ncbi:MAG: ATP-dependent Clp protease adaptor ClpS [Pirellulaceae bacterium]|jgi:ATP-dependent Clp protease adaptor protein ClpS|nr:ATP-dependent Clp protease adaptor ClpS [Pirellulaceae bacterium]